MKVLASFLVCASIFTCNGPAVCPQSTQCTLDPDPGLCKALIKRYYYDQVEKKCKEFNWGGCEGVVPFETLEACKQCECTVDY